MAIGATLSAGLFIMNTTFAENDVKNIQRISFISAGTQHHILTGSEEYNQTTDPDLQLFEGPRSTSELDLK